MVGRATQGNTITQSNLYDLPSGIRMPASDLSEFGLTNVKILGPNTNCEALRDDVADSHRPVLSPNQFIAGKTIDRAADTGDAPLQRGLHAVAALLVAIHADGIFVIEELDLTGPLVLIPGGLD